MLYQTGCIRKDRRGGENMTVRPENRGNEIRVKGKSMGRERSGEQRAGRVAAASKFGDMLERVTVLFEAPSLANLAGRTLLMLAGIVVMALGIDIVVRAGLGNSPISACPNVLSLAFTQVSFGVFMLVWQCVLVAVQIVILRREFRAVDLLQIPIFHSLALRFRFCLMLLWYFPVLAKRVQVYRQLHQGCPHPKD